MTDKELIEFPINDYADRECQLFVWVTHGKLPFCLELIKKWGFKYHCLLTWNKTKGIVICGINRMTEFVVYAYKGKQELKLKGVSIPAIFKEKSTVHSAKPRIFYDLLLKSTPEPRIDIFSRKKHFGFDSWGNQAENPLTLEAYI